MRQGKLKISKTLNHSLFEGDNELGRSTSGIVKRSRKHFEKGMV